MEQLCVAHLINPYLPVTQNWIYQQIINNPHVSSHVICRTIVNIGQFPLPAVFKVHPAPSLFYHLEMLLARIRGTYRTGACLDYCRTVKPHILHAHFAWEAWRYRDLIRKLHIPLVTTFYGVDISRLPKHQIWRQRYTTLFEMGRAFCVEGPHMAQCLRDLGCPGTKIKIIRIGVPVQEFQNNRTESPLAHDSGRVNILFVGLTKEKKGAVYAIQSFFAAAKASPQSIHLHIIGDGHYRSIVERAIKKTGAGSLVTLYGMVDVVDYRRLLTTMDIVLAPSITARSGDTEGGAPVTLIEAQASAIPVVATTHCDIPDVVIHGTTGLLAPEKNVAALTQNLLTLIASAPLRRTMGLAGQRHVRRQHDIATQVGALNTLYQSLLR